MAKADVIAAAVERAVVTAVIDPDAPTEPRDERCQFDPAALAHVLRLCDSGHNRDLAYEAVDLALRRSVEELDSDRTLAAVMLRARIDAGTARRQVPVENIEGQVGTGLGSDSAQT